MFPWEPVEKWRVSRIKFINRVPELVNYGGLTFEKWEILRKVDVNKKMVHQVTHEHWIISKISVRWNPRILPRNDAHNVSMFMDMSKDMEEESISRTVTRDLTWISQWHLEILNEYNVCQLYGSMLIINYRSSYTNKKNTVETTQYTYA